MAEDMVQQSREATPDRGARRSESIRSVERAIDLLQALNRRACSTLHDLHRDTGLPKPSIVRLLRTLEAKGLVAQSASYGSYHLRGHVQSLSCGFHHDPMIVEVADRMMVEFTRREGWPLTLALFDRDAMVVRASTIPHTSLSLLHSSLNMRLSMVSRALGRCYLAHCPPQERRIIVEIVRRTGREEDALAHHEGELEDALNAVRQQGYAVRDPGTEPRSSTLAVPIMDGDRVAATLGLTWISVAMSRDRAVETYYRQLAEMAGRVSAAMPNRYRPPAGKAGLPPTFLPDRPPAALNALSAAGADQLQ